jgi:hypothetical protein
VAGKIKSIKNYNGPIWNRTCDLVAQYVNQLCHRISPSRCILPNSTYLSRLEAGKPITCSKGTNLEFHLDNLPTRHVVFSCMLR